MSELFLWILSNLQLVVFVLMVLAQLALATIFFLEAFGTPRWVAIGGVVLLPVVSWLVVRFSHREENMTSLALGSQDH